jgi:PAS domain-containing protein
MISEAALQELIADSDHKKALLKAIPDMIFLLDYEGVYLDYRGGRGMAFIPGEHIIGSSIYDSDMPRPLVEAIMAHVRHAIDHCELHEIRYDLPFPSGETRSYNSRAVRYGEGQAVRIVRDITDWVRDRNELTQNLARLEQFAFLTSHELRVPVANILGLASLFDLELLPGEERDYIQKFAIAARQLDAITRQMQQLLGDTNKCTKGCLAPDLP